MIHVRRSRQKFDSRIYWKCPKCKADSVIFSVSPETCPFCYTSLPNILNILNFQKARINYIDGGWIKID